VTYSIIGASVCGVLVLLVHSLVVVDHAALYKGVSGAVALVGLWVWVLSPYAVLFPVVRKRENLETQRQTSLLGTLIICIVGLAVTACWALIPMASLSEWVFLYVPIGQWVVVGLLAY